MIKGYSAISACGWLSIIIAILAAIKETLDE